MKRDQQSSGSEQSGASKRSTPKSASPAPRRTGSVMNLQRTAGNRAVSDRLAGSEDGPVVVQRSIETALKALMYQSSDDEIAQLLAKTMGKAGVDTKLGDGAKGGFGAGAGTTGASKTKATTTSLAPAGVTPDAWAQMSAKDKIAALKQERDTEKPAPTGTDSKEDLDALKALEAEKKQRLDSDATRTEITQLEESGVQLSAEQQGVVDALEKTDPAAAATRKLKFLQKQQKAQTDREATKDKIADLEGDDVKLTATQQAKIDELAQKDPVAAETRKLAMLTANQKRDKELESLHDESDEDIEGEAEITYLKQEKQKKLAAAQFNQENRAMNQQLKDFANNMKAGNTPKTAFEEKGGAKKVQDRFGGKNLSGNVTATGQNKMFALWGKLLDKKKEADAKTN
jgi:hypothetical protein